MAIENYYGKKAGQTILQIFTQPNDGGPPIIHRKLVDSEAYDTWHLSYYFKEILEYKRLMDRSSISLSDIPRPEKNLLLYLLFAANMDFSSVAELGSSLFEMIDGFEAMEKYIKDKDSSLPLVPIKHHAYHGIELSEMLRLTSRVLHPDFKLYLYEKVSDFHGPVDLLYDRSVTNYAYESVDELLSFVRCGRAALLNTYFSLEETFQSSRLGKTLTYFSLEEFLSKIDKPFYHLFGLKAPGPYSGEDIGLGRKVIEGFFFYGEQMVIDNFMEMARQDAQVASYFDQKRIHPKDPRTVKPS
jgi:hypothetical protein